MSANANEAESILLAEFNKRIAGFVPALKEVADYSAGYIRQRAPVRTGFLRDHTGTEVNEQEYSILLFSNAWYSAIVNSRNPYFDDTVETTKEKFSEEFR
jgi:hypothetical protein